jgi:hypothetical protein
MCASSDYAKLSKGTGGQARTLVALTVSEKRAGPAGGLLQDEGGHRFLGFSSRAILSPVLPRDPAIGGRKF